MRWNRSHGRHGRFTLPNLRSALMPDVSASPLAADTLVSDSEEQKELLTQEHTILDRALMKFRPFGKDEQGQKIADVSGTLVVSAIQHLEHCVEKSSGTASVQSVEQLCRLLNGR